MVDAAADLLRRVYFRMCAKAGGRKCCYKQILRQVYNDFPVKSCCACWGLPGVDRARVSKVHGYLFLSGLGFFAERCVGACGCPVPMSTVSMLQAHPAPLYLHVVSCPSLAEQAVENTPAIQITFSLSLEEKFIPVTTFCLTAVRHKEGSCSSWLFCSVNVTVVTSCRTENTPTKWLVWRSLCWRTDTGDFCFEVNQPVQFSCSSRCRCSPQHHRSFPFT